MNQQDQIKRQINAAKDYTHVLKKNVNNVKNGFSKRRQN